MTSQAIKDIEDACANRVLKGGWAPDADDKVGGEIWAAAASVYAEWAASPEAHKVALDWAAEGITPPRWPLYPEFYKPTDRRADLVTAAAWIVAEIEYIDRMAAKTAKANDAGTIQ